MCEQKCDSFTQTYQSSIDPYYKFMSCYFILGDFKLFVLKTKATQMTLTPQQALIQTVTHNKA